MSQSVSSASSKSGRSNPLAAGSDEGRSRRVRWGDLWRSIFLGVLCFLMILPLIIALIVSLKAP